VRAPTTLAEASPVPDVSRLCRRVAADLARVLPELSHVKAARILFVAGEARRASRATVSPLGGPGAPYVSIRGRRQLYCVTLRPKFFRSSTAEQRAATILHELLHASPAFDGTLDASRRHGRHDCHDRLDRVRYAERVRELLSRYLEEGSPALLAALGRSGVVTALQWLVRPGRTGGRRRFDEADLFGGPVQMLSRSRRLH
jgi:predicted metallopeptidase